MTGDMLEIAVNLLAQTLTDKDLIDLAEIAILHGDDIKKPDPVVEKAYKIMIEEEDFHHPEGRLVKGRIGAIMYLRSKNPNLGLKEAKNYVEGDLMSAYLKNKARGERNKMAQLFLEIKYARSRGIKVL